MINVNELMIGNYVKSYNGNVWFDSLVSKINGTERSLWTETIPPFREWYLIPKEVKPVEITPEILGRLGFSENTTGVFFKSLIHDEGEWDVVTVYLLHEISIKISGVFDCSIRDLQYVHELQNLVYALTKQTLTLDSTGGEL